jgi:hypothetical protein
MQLTSANSGNAAKCARTSSYDKTEWFSKVRPASSQESTGVNLGMKLHVVILLALVTPAFNLSAVPPGQSKAGEVAPTPLYRDPIYDGAADPALVWNRAEKTWLM